VCSCNCYGSKEDLKEDKLDFTRIHELVQSIKINTRYLRIIKILQATIKGILIRKKYNINLKSKSTFMPALDYTDIEITEEINNLLKNLNNNFKPLNDGVNVLGRKSIRYEDGSFYYGEWDHNEDQRHGRGILINGSVKYDGYFRFNKKSIYGRNSLKNGNWYIGEFVNDKYSGYGIFDNVVEGISYEGLWKNSFKEGQGKEVNNKTGSIFTGEFKNDKKNGLGKFIFKNGDEYEGTFIDNQLNGKGSYFWKEEKDQLISDWKINQINGVGVYLWNGGTKFVGEIKNDLNEGTSAFEFPFGVRYKYPCNKGMSNHEEAEFYDPDNKNWKCLIEKEKSLNNSKFKRSEKTKVSGESKKPFLPKKTEIKLY